MASKTAFGKLTRSRIELNLTQKMYERRRSLLKLHIFPTLGEKDKGERQLYQILEEKR